MKGLVFATCVMILMVNTSLYSQSVKDIVDSIGQAFLSTPNNVGLAIGIIQDGQKQVFYFGGKTQKSSQDIDDNTLFEIGSIGKTYTAYILASLEQEGLLNSIDLLAQFLPDNVSRGKKWKNKIRLVDLATHSSGLPSFHDIDDYRQYPGFEEEDPFKIFTSEFILNILDSINSLPNYGRFEYSNFSPGLLGYCLEKASGLSYEDLVVKYIRKPLNLKSAFLRIPKNQTSQLAKPHRNGVERPFIKLHGLKAAGIIKSSMPDLLEFLSLHIDAKNQHQKEIINTVLKEQRIKAEIRLGLGWGISTLEEITLYDHSGGTFGSSSRVVIAPEINAAVAILENNRGTSNHFRMAQRIMQSLIKTYKTK